MILLKIGLTMLEVDLGYEKNVRVCSLLLVSGRNAYHVGWAGSP